MAVNGLSRNAFQVFLDNLRIYSVVIQSTIENLVAALKLVSNVSRELISELQSHLY